ETPPAGVTSAFIARCESDQRTFETFPFTPFARIGSSSRIGISLLAGEQLTCWWYDVPSKSAPSSPAASPVGGTTVKISLFACPGQSVNLAQCQPGSGGTEFTLDPASVSGQPITLTTDDAGVAGGSVP